MRARRDLLQIWAVANSEPGRADELGKQLRLVGRVDIVGQDLSEFGRCWWYRVHFRQGGRLYRVRVLRDRLGCLPS